MHVTVATEEERNAILGEGGLFYDKRKQGGHGRVLRSPVPRLGLHALDRLEPGPSLLDIADFDRKLLPLKVVFWRRHLHGGRVTDKVLHRNPLLNAPLMDAVNVIMLDTLHTVYLGVILR